MAIDDFELFSEEEIARQKKEENERQEREAFENLPEEEKQKILEHRIQQQKMVDAYRERISKRSLVTAIVGGIGAIATGSIQDTAVLVLLAMAIAGFISGWLIVTLRGSQLSGMFVYSVPQIVLAVIGSRNMLLMFFAWILVVGLGAFLGFWVDSQRSAQDSF